MAAFSPSHSSPTSTQPQLHIASSTHFKTDAARKSRVTTESNQTFASNATIPTSSESAITKNVIPYATTSKPTPTFKPLNAITKVPIPTRTLFDPWNSASTGHQRAENHLSGSTSWRDSRTYKLRDQMKDTSGGGGRAGHLSDLVGAGSENFGKDRRKDNGDWEVGAPGLQGEGWQDVRDLLAQNQRKLESMDRKKKRDNKDKEMETVDYHGPPLSNMQHVLESPPQGVPSSIFQGLTVFINGSTAPLVSDLRLKQLLAQNGANISISLGRRTVTHVILGHSTHSKAHGLDRGKGITAGGGLAASKIQKEITTVRGKGVKFVNAAWVLESIKAGKRLPEGAFQALHAASKGQKSVYGMFAKKKRDDDSVVD